MKKIYERPDAEYIALESEEEIMAGFISSWFIGEDNTNEEGI